MQRCLVFFSGGKDSFITACRKAIEGSIVTLISFNNGSVAAEENFKHGADRLVKRFGEKVEIAGVFSTASVFSRLRLGLSNVRLDVLADSFPSAHLSQLMCMLCQSSMWASGIAYCIAHKIPTICTGYKKTDVFCTGDYKWLSAIRDIANSFNIEVETPMWETTCDISIDNELMRYGFKPGVLEPKCMLGLPASAMSESEQRDIIAYFEKFVYSTLISEVNELVPIYKSQINNGKTLS